MHEDNNYQDENEIPAQKVEPRAGVVDLVPTIIQTWTETKLMGGKLTAETLAIMVTDGLQHDPRVLEWVADNTKVTKAEFKKEVAAQIRRSKIQDEFGRMPQHAQDYVDLYAKSEKIHCKFNGDMHRTGTPYLMLDGKKQYVVEPELVNCGTIQCELTVKFHAPINLDGLKRTLRLTSSRLKLGFNREEIEDAVTAWHEAERAERKLELMGTIHVGETMPLHRDAAKDLWRELAERCFDLSEVSAEFVIAALQKFIHQVARKFIGLPVYDHLMVCILGRQNGGKSTFVKKLFSPIAEVAAETNFRQIEDDRNIDLFNHYVLFLDEMGHADRANMEAIKHAITAEKLTLAGARPSRIALSLGRGW